MLFDAIFSNVRSKISWKLLVFFAIQDLNAVWLKKLHAYHDTKQHGIFRNSQLLSLTIISICII